MANVNSIFSTGNSTVASLPVGATLQVVGVGQLQVTSVPAKQFEAGDVIYTKYGRSIVVAPSSRFGEIEGFDPETQILYVADGSFKVRAVNKSSL